MPRVILVIKADIETAQEMSSVVSTIETLDLPVEVVEAHFSKGQPNPIPKVK